MDCASRASTPAHEDFARGMAPARASRAPGKVCRTDSEARLTSAIGATERAAVLGRILSVKGLLEPTLIHHAETACASRHLGRSHHEALVVVARRP